MKVTKYISAAALLLCLGSCSDFLTQGDPNKVDGPTYFRTENDLRVYTNGFIENMLPSALDIATGDARADYLAYRGEYQYLTDNYDADDQGGWSTGVWGRLRNINYFLDNFRRADVSEDILLHYEGVARFWRAIFYFDMVKTFGAVPFYDTEISSDDRERLYKGRDNREYVMQKVLEDINFACENCSDSPELLINSSRINRYIALAVKSRICLFEGTYRKYHEADPSTGDYWREDESALYLGECVSACEALMNAGVYSLYAPGNTSVQYRELFTSTSVITKEVIWARVYDESLSAVHNLNCYFTNMQYGSYSPVKQFINTYLNTDGTPFTNKPGYETIPFTSEFEGRDLRLRQSIRYPGYTRLSGGFQVRTAPDYNYSVTGYQPIKWLIDDTSMDSNTSPCATCIPIIRYAEILLNYAEAKAELGQFDAAVWNKTIKPLRERSGVKSVRPSVADPYMKDYFLGRVTDADLLEIRRERGIELFMENLRWDDDMRWAMGDLLQREWLGVYVGELGKVYDMDGDGVGETCFVANTPSSRQAGVTYRVLGSDFSLTGGTSGNLKCYIQLNRRWDDRKYVHPIPTNALNVNENLGQNPGWEK